MRVFLEQQPAYSAHFARENVPLSAESIYSWMIYTSYLKIHLTPRYGVVNLFRMLTYYLLLG